MTGKISRRRFIRNLGVSALGAAVAGSMPVRAVAGPFIKNRRISKRVLVLGIDGMDPALLRRFMAEGLMPTFASFGANGYLGPMQTTLPPQSPVAWASFITGANPGKHGIFDFVHRDPSTFTPYLSTSRSYPATKTVEFLDYVIPMESGRVELLRRGTPFWHYLDKQDIPAAFYQLPANFPVEQTKTSAISGMGTPDLLGTYGTYTFITDMPDPPALKKPGGRHIKVRPADNVVRTSLEGPVNSFHSGNRPVSVDMTIYRDRTENVARIVLQDTDIILKKGEWSDWVPVTFNMVSLLASSRGMVRFYLQETHPHLKLYVSPINIDPLDPSLPISCPAEHAGKVAEKIGRFTTLGFPEDTKALSNSVFSDAEFLSLSRLILAERLAALEYSLKNFDEGLLFFYFSTIDQNSHMLLRNLDPSHPLYDTNAPPEVRNAIRFCYHEMDKALKFALSMVDSDTTVIVMSDHGFAPFTREFNLSTWLAGNGYTNFTDRRQMHTTDLYEAVNWRKTKAYVLGINGIYLNLAGRERQGTVNPGKAEQLKEEIIAKLKTVEDPATGRKVFRDVYNSKRAFSGPYLDIAPDIVVGYESGYRISDESVLGKFPEGLFADRTDKWCSDHCMDPAVVPGVLITSKEIAHQNPSICDLAPTILAGFGIKPEGDMDGRPLLSEKASA